MYHFFAYIYSMSMSNMRARRPNKKFGTFNFIFYVLQDHYNLKETCRGLMNFKINLEKN